MVFNGMYKVIDSINSLIYFFTFCNGAKKHNHIKVTCILYFHARSAYIEVINMILVVSG